MNSQIILKDMRFRAFHGVLPQERTIGATFIVDLTLEADLLRAVKSDRLEDTINYADIYEEVREEMAQPSQLLEHAAGRILNRLMSRHEEIRGIEVTLSKVNPPLGAEVGASAVRLGMSREEWDSL